MIEQTSDVFRVILNQIIFNNGKYFKPTKGIAMGWFISRIVSKIYLQFFEDLTIGHWLESGEIVYYRRYLADKLIIPDQNKTN